MSPVSPGLMIRSAGEKAAGEAESSHQSSSLSERALWFLGNRTSLDSQLLAWSGSPPPNLARCINPDPL